jgi:hypothetical protein
MNAAYMPTYPDVPETFPSSRLLTKASTRTSMIRESGPCLATPMDVGPIVYCRDYVVP